MKVSRGFCPMEFGWGDDSRVSDSEKETDGRIDPHDEVHIRVAILCVEGNYLGSEFLNRR